LAEGRAAGRAEEAGGNEAQAAAALAMIARGLDAAGAEMREAAEESAAALARLLLAVLDAALPGVVAHGAEDRVAALVASLLPALAEQTRIVVRVAPPIAEGVAARLAADPRMEVTGDAAVAPGDARVEWRGGCAESVLEDRRRAVRAALATLGLEG